MVRPSIEDIDRIEVVSGPGGTLYGANAVNGVINIITRRSGETQGPAISLGAGNEDRTLTLRHGWRMGESGAARAYLYAFDRDTSLRANGDDATDDTSGVRGGLRSDWTFGADTLTVQGEIFRNRLRVNEDFSGQGTHAKGGHILGRWTRDFEARGELQLQLVYDRMQLTEPLITETDDTSDVQLQHAFAWGSRHRIVWGAGYREVATELDSRVPGVLIRSAGRSSSATCSRRTRST
jgi:iron complex outermembrane receptor protein